MRVEVILNRYHNSVCFDTTGRHIRTNNPALLISLNSVDRVHSSFRNFQLPSAGIRMSRVQKGNDSKGDHALEMILLLQLLSASLFVCPAAAEYLSG